MRPTTAYVGYPTKKWWQMLWRVPVWYEYDGRRAEGEAICGGHFEFDAMLEVQFGIMDFYGIPVTLDPCAEREAREWMTTMADSERSRLTP